MSIKDVKAEARSKLALNMHQAIALYTIEYAVFSILLATIVLACVSIGSIHLIASIVLICYGSVLMLAAIIGAGIFNHGMVDYYLASYKCKPYNIRRLGDTLARNGLVKILTLNLRRVIFSFLLLLCLIVPGIIYLIRTSMASNLLIANPKMKASTALSASGKVMGGKSGTYFSMMMSLLGWWILGILTFGLGYIFIMPYINMCKTVYYKRNLQGDRTVYKTVVQPVSPMPTPQQMQQMQQMQYGMTAGQYNQVQARTVQPQAQPQFAQPASAHQQQPLHVAQPDVSAPLPPIDALEDDDMSELNAAIRDLEAEEKNVVVDVPEVAINPVQKTKTGVQPSVKMNANTDEPKYEEPKYEEPKYEEPKYEAPKHEEPKYEAPKYDEPKHEEQISSGFIETVKPLTTREVEESDVMGRKIDRMFAGAETTNVGEKHNYFAGFGKSGPNDFVTRESDSIDDISVKSDIADDKPNVSIGDNGFDDFMRSFDAPKSEGEFKPLTRTPKSVPVEDINIEDVTDTDHEREQRFASPRTKDGESRVDRLRREREERRKKSGK